MRIAAIIATERKNGNSMLAAKYISKKLSADLEIIRLTKMRIEPCKACYACLYGIECRIKDDVYNIYDTILESDAVLICSPVYWLDATGRLKAFIDRVFMAIPYLENFAHKKAAIVTIYGFEDMNGWASATHNVLARALGLNLLANVEVHAALPGEILTKKENLKKLDTVVKALSDGIKIVDKNQCPVCMSSVFRVNRKRLFCPICGSELDFDLNVIKEGDRFFNNMWLLEHYESLKSMKKIFKNLMKELENAKKIVEDDDIDLV